VGKRKTEVREPRTSPSAWLLSGLPCRRNGEHQRRCTWYIGLLVRQSLIDPSPLPRFATTNLLRAAYARLSWCVRVGFRVEAPADRPNVACLRPPRGQGHRLPTAKTSHVEKDAAVIGAEKLWRKSTLAQYHQSC
jgi:hypothetical protein